MRHLVALAVLACALGQRPATVIRVIDGDTVVLRMDLGFESQLEGPCRLAGIDAPELWTAAGVPARNWMVARLTAGEPVCFEGSKREKYGRPLVTIFDLGGNVNDAIAAAGHARRLP